jgi:muramoyltetrapeptide carboxypeptidase
MQDSELRKRVEGDPSVRMLKIEADGDFRKGLLKPKIRIMGHWLERAGFRPGNHVHVIAVLLNAITAKTGLLTFHGPNIVGKLEETDHSDLGLVREPIIGRGSNLLAGASKVQTRCVKPGIGRGRLFGGNLNCFVLGLACSSINLDFFDGGIFFWEDLGLTPRQINQYLTALHNIGLFDRISGMVVGEFITPESENRVSSDPFEALIYPMRDYNFPVFYAPLFGHRKLENPIFPIGAMCELDATAGILLLLEDCVSSD